MTPIVIDTEIGNHIDDAFALAVACSAADLNLLAVTTTGESPRLRAALARRLLIAFGVNVPVAAGEALDEDRLRLRGCTRRLAEEAAVEASPTERLGAVDLLRQVVTESPGLTLVATGPLTNIARLLERYPEVESRIGRLVFMGGWASQGLPEYNLRTDPEALDVILRSKIPLLAVGYEVTLGCTLRRGLLERMASAEAPGPRYVYTLFEAWRSDTGRKVAPIMHDPLTLALLCREDLVRTVTFPVKVMLEKGPGRGALLRDPEGRPVRVCAEVDSAGYLEWLVDTITSGHMWKERGVAAVPRWHVQLKEAYHVSHYAGWSNMVEQAGHHVLIVVTGGTGSVMIGDDSYELSSGCALYIPMHTPFRMETEAGMRSYWFHFSCHAHASAVSCEELARIPGMDTFYPPQGETHFVVQSAEKILSYWLHPYSEGQVLSDAALLDALARLLLVAHAKEREASPDAVVQEAERFIQAHARQALSLEMISQHVGMSKYHLTRKFTKAYGVSPVQYHTRVRMQHAKRLLALRTMPVKEVAAQLGYSSLHAFSRAFHREVGVPPSMFAE